MAEWRCASNTQMCACGCFFMVPPTKVPRANQPPATKFTRLLESTGSPPQHIKRTTRVLAQVSVDIGSSQRLEPKVAVSSGSRGHSGRGSRWYLLESSEDARASERMESKNMGSLGKRLFPQSNGSAKKRNPVPRTVSSKLFFDMEH